MSEATYQGGCHCGAVRYRVELDLSQPVYACNCSMCAKGGTLLTFVAEDKFTLEQGEEALADYQFHKKIIHHHFCRHCGIKPFARGKRRDGSPTVAVNARCLEGVDPDALTVKKVDGKSF